MSCYFRHIKGLLDEAGIQVTRDNRKALHTHIARTVGDPEADCPTTWKQVKEWRDDPDKRAQLVAGLGEFAG